MHTRHKARVILMILIALLLLPPFGYAMSGREVYEKVQEVRNKKLDQKVESTMVLFDRGGGRRTRTLTEYGKNAGPGAFKSLVVFSSPADFKDVGFLLHARTFADRDLWAYFPDFKRVRRIPTSSRDDSFFGSDFSFDDFSGPPELDDYSFALIREEIFSGRPCFVVEVTPHKPRRYTKYISWIDKNLWVTVKIEYYRDRELYRSGLFSDIRMIDGIPTPFRYEMENMKTKHRTMVTINSIAYHTRYPDEFFSHRSLERGGR